MKEGYLRVASCVPEVDVANCKANTCSVISILKELHEKNVEIAVFPEMCVTAYTCADLFHNVTLLDGALDALNEIKEATAALPNIVAIVGAPLLHKGILYNCAYVILNGEVKGIVPKTYIPNYNEFYEKRWWHKAPEQNERIEIESLQCNCIFGAKQIFEFKGAKFGVEICEDMWTTIPPSSYLALSGAQLILNLSASDDLIGKYAYLQSLIKQQSARCLCAYAYSSAGFGESSTDLVFDGKAIICENGNLLQANERWQNDSQYVIADIDLMAIDRDRMHNGSFADTCDASSAVVSQIECVRLQDTREEREIDNTLLRYVDPQPFVPPTDAAMAARCNEIINIQAAALAKRLKFIRCDKLVVGISGGLDSTLALLVAARAYDRLGIDRKGIIGITMPGFGTTSRTKSNAIKLMEQLNTTILEIPIGNAVAQHFADIDHDPNVHDVTYENSQARERTQILMDYANKCGGIVLGTGDLSELALGWATYNGDHMSMYAVNAGVPKTLVKYLVGYFATLKGFEGCRDTLLDIIDTPISPELIPADSNDNITQKTEDLVGPYELHDFFLYYTLRYGFSPKRIYFLAKIAFAGKYSNDFILKWLRVFYRRFFQQQFKRSCLPDGPKVGSVCLSPRGDWRMPSDASAALWLSQIETIS